MNERIIELAVQADLLIKKSNGDEFRSGYFDPKFQKFAELIVRNCVNELITQMWPHGIDESNNPSFYKAIEKTIEEFGIKGVFV